MPETLTVQTMYTELKRQQRLLKLQAQQRKLALEKQAQEQTVCAPPRPGESGVLGEAVAFLRHALAEVSRLATSILGGARKAGIAQMTLKRAKFLLEVKSDRNGNDGLWYWQLPGRLLPLSRAAEVETYGRAEASPTAPADHANDQVNHANLQGDHANWQEDHAKGQGDHANRQEDHAKGQGDHPQMSGKIPGGGHRQGIPLYIRRDFILVRLSARKVEFVIFTFFNVWARGGSGPRHWAPIGIPAEAGR